MRYDVLCKNHTQTTENKYNENLLGVIFLTYFDPNSHILKCDCRQPETPLSYVSPLPSLFICNPLLVF